MILAALAGYIAVVWLAVIVTNRATNVAYSKGYYEGYSKGYKEGFNDWAKKSLKSSS